MPPTTAELLDTFRIERHRLLDAGRRRPRTDPVAHLPGWAVHDVLAHVAGDYRWALDIVRRRSTVGAKLGRSEAIGDTLLDEIAELGAELDEELVAGDPDEPCPNFTGAGTMRFWSRRQAHETTIHRWDVEAADDHAPIAEQLAIDGIDEVFEVYATRWTGHAVSVPLTIGCPNREVAWRVEAVGDDGGIAVCRSKCAEPLDLAVDPSDLLLLLWHRLPVMPAHVHGSLRPDAVTAFVRGPLTA